jgi:predicted RNA-binding protein with PIN domain
MRWIVDAMNVIGARPDGWWKDRGRARVKLVEDLERWACEQGHEVTVVFEGPPSPAIGSAVIGVSHAAKALPNSADDEIVRLVRGDRRPEQLIVVTSDTDLTDRVRAAGASTHPAAGFRELIDPRHGLETK